MKTITKQNHKRSFAALIAGMFLLSGCSSQFAVGDAVSLVATEKTFGDHAISVLSGKDCSTVRKELGLTYCKEDDFQRQPEEERHCYNELGKVTCYQKADIHSVRSGIEDKKEPPRKWKKPLF